MNQIRVQLEHWPDNAASGRPAWTASTFDICRPGEAHPFLTANTEAELRERFPVVLAEIAGTPVEIEWLPVRESRWVRAPSMKQDHTESVVGTKSKQNVSKSRRR